MSHPDKQTAEITLSRQAEDAAAGGNVPPEGENAPTESEENPSARLTPDFFLSRRRTGEMVYVFDLRDPETYVGDHLAGAFNLPFEYLSDSLYRLPFNGSILLYDGGEGTARQAAATLEENGFSDFFYVEEGLEALKQTLDESPDEIHYEKLSAQERVAAIERVLDQRVRGFLAKDGGGLEVRGVEEDRVLVAYQGACGSCSSSTAGTLRFIESSLTVALNHPIQVIPQDDPTPAL
ncbi:MAG: NifU family protein [Deltaproteobacteria bacterium]|nr:NifU family protein [Deltaproteobacteria bacterium]